MPLPTFYCKVFSKSFPSHVSMIVTLGINSSGQSGYISHLATHMQDSLALRFLALLGPGVLEMFCHFSGIFFKCASLSCILIAITSYWQLGPKTMSCPTLTTLFTTSQALRYFCPLTPYIIPFKKEYTISAQTEVTCQGHTGVNGRSRARIPSSQIIILGTANYPLLLANGIHFSN